MHPKMPAIRANGQIQPPDLGSMIVEDDANALVARVIEPDSSL
jgi:hypothetical protein